MWRKRIKYDASPRRASLPPALSLPYVYSSQCGCYRLHLTDGQTTARGRGSCLAAKSRTRGCAGDARGMRGCVRVRAQGRPPRLGLVAAAALSCTPELLSTHVLGSTPNFVIEPGASKQHP